MKLKFNGMWKQSLLRIKHLCAWRSPYRTMIKHNGMWKDDHLIGMLNSLYNGTVNVGSSVGWDYTAYGWVVNGFGTTNNTTTKFVNKVAAIITGTKPYYNAPPFQWLEMSVEGDLMGVVNQIGDITVNGIAGRLVRTSYGGIPGARTFIGWVFDQPLPTSGQWVINLLDNGSSILNVEKQECL